MRRLEIETHDNGNVGIKIGNAGPDNNIPVITVQFTRKEAKFLTWLLTRKLNHNGKNDVTAKSTDSDQD